MTEENKTYLVKVWDHIPQAGGTAKNIFTVVGTMKRRTDKDGNLLDEFTLFPTKGLAITGQCSIQPYVKNGDTDDKSDDAGETEAADDTQDQAAE